MMVMAGAFVLAGIIGVVVLVCGVLWLIWKARRK